MHGLCVYRLFLSLSLRLPLSSISSLSRCQRRNNSFCHSFAPVPPLFLFLFFLRGGVVVLFAGLPDGATPDTNNTLLAVLLVRKKKIKKDKTEDLYLVGEDRGRILYALIRYSSCTVGDTSLGAARYVGEKRVATRLRTRARKPLRIHDGLLLWYDIRCVWCNGRRWCVRVQYCMCVVCGIMLDPVVM